jgi:hypothetical protein
MRTFTANIIILSAVIADNFITGTAIDGNTAINYSVAANSVNERLFLPESQLVITGKLRLAAELATVNIWIAKVVAVISIPVPTANETTAIETATPAAPLSRAQKAAATHAAKKATKTQAKKPVAV